MRTFAQKQHQSQKPMSSSLARPHLATPGQTHHEHPLLHLQRAIGNQAVLRMVQTHTEERDAGLTTAASPRFGHDFSRIPIHPPPAGAIQTKLAINQPGDQYEQEADRISEQVMRMPEPGLQRTCACGGTCPQCQSEQPDPEQERLQTKRVGSSDLGQSAAPPIVNDVLAAPGHPLDPATSTFMGSRFGHDFSQVRIHTGSAAEQSAHDVNAHAYTVGQDIVFGEGRYRPNTADGQRLLAHELTHIIQQAGHTVASLQRKEKENGDQQTVSNTSDDLYPTNHAYIAGMGPGDRITGRHLFEWARARGYARVVADSTLRKMQEQPGIEDEVVDDIYLLLVDRLWGQAYDPETGSLEANEFEGSDNARGHAVFELLEHWDQEVGTFLHRQLALFYERELVGAYSRTPQGASLELHPDAISRVRMHPYRHTADTGRWGILARVGERYGSMHIADIYNPGGDEAAFGTIWFYLDDHPSWFYEISATGFATLKDPVVAEVARSVSESTKLVGELFPLIIKLGGFALGMSGSLALLIAGSVLNELGEEGLREVRREKHRSAWEILKSATVDVFIGHIMNRVFSAPTIETAAVETGSGSELVTALEDRTAGAVRREIAATEAPQINAELRAGHGHLVEDAALQDEGYITEVEIVSEGQVHTYRRTKDGTWCRFTGLICFEPEEAPGSEWDEIFEEAERQNREALLKRTARRARRTFVAGGIRFEIRGSEGAFAALEAAPAGAQVYVLRDASEQVIYVGFVGQQTAGRTAINRLQEHLREKTGEFLGDASSLEIKGVGLEEREGRALEDQLITDYKDPKWNKRENDPQNYRRKYRTEPLPEEVRRANTTSLIFTINLQ